MRIFFLAALPVLLASCSSIGDSLGFSRYPADYQDYALILSIERPYSELQEKFIPPAHTTENIGTKRGFSSAVWDKSDNRSTLKTTFENDSMKEWWYVKETWDFINPRSYSLNPSWLAANKPLLELMHAHRQGDLKEIRSLYLRYPTLDNHNNHLTGAILAAKENRRKIIEYYISERQLSPDETVNSWIEVIDRVSGERKNRSHRYSIRQATLDSNPEKVLLLLTDKPPAP